MKAISYLIDDASVGGVTRTLDSQIALLEPQFDVTQSIVNAYHPLPPQLGEDAVVIHFTPSWGKLPFLTLLRAQRPNRPVVLVEHTYTASLERQCVHNVTRFRTMLKLAYSLVDAVVCVSHGQARWIRDARLAPAEKIRVIRSATDCRHLFDIAPPSRGLERPMRLAAYGRYTRQKGFDVLIEAMHSVQPDIASLTIAGYGPDEDALKRAAAGLPHVHVGAGITDLEAFLSDCDAVVVPSRWEAFGLVASEARSAARPIIVSDLDGLSEQVSRDAGIAVVSEDPRLLADAIYRLGGSDLAAMGRAARTSVAGHFEQHVRGYNDLLVSLTTAVEAHEHDYLSPAA